MEYVVFLACVLAIALLCGAVLRSVSVRRAPQRQSDASRRTSITMARDAARTRHGGVPWGWPDGGRRLPRRPNRAGGRSSDATGRGEWVDQLLAQKRTVDDPEYRDRARQSLRALVEDRYGGSAPARRRQEGGRDQRSGRTSLAVGEANGAAPIRSLSKLKSPWGW